MNPDDWRSAADEWVYIDPPGPDEVEVPLIGPDVPDETES